MKKVKKNLPVVLAAVLALSLFITACSNNTPSASGNSPSPAVTNPGESEGGTFTLPSVISWTAYDVGGTGYIHASAIANALKQQYGITMRVVPAGTDVARISPLLTGAVDFCATGSGSWLAFEGLEEFSTSEWGPQNLRLVWDCVPDTGMCMATAADADIKTAADAAGKRVAYVVGNPSTNLQMEAFLAFGGLTWDDVQVVEYASYSAALQGLVENTCDAAAATSDGSPLYELEGSSRGYYIVPMPAEDTEGWARLQAICPYLVPAVATSGAGCSPENPVEISRFPTPNLVTYAEQDADYVYEMCKMIDETFDLYKDAHASTSGWAIDRLEKQWVIPMHEGSIRYLTEVGHWTQEDQEYNDALLERQEALSQAFDSTLDESYANSVNSADFQQLWLDNRSAALEAAGLETYR